MTLAIYDDGKGKCQSWEVSLMEENYPFGYLIKGFGETKEEAINEFKKEFKRTYHDILNMLNALENDMYEEVKVDYLGIPIKE